MLPPQFVQLPLRGAASLRRASCCLHHLRSIVTSSIEPSLDARMERPETIVLIESSLYSSNSNNSNSWKEAFESFYPKRGLHFSSIDIFRSHRPSLIDASSTQIIPSVKSLEHTLASDLSYLATSIGIGAAHTVLIARGPIQCLIAQYFLESLPLAGLVLVDPLVLPNDGRVKKQSATFPDGSAATVVDKRWGSSLKDLISLLDGNAPDMYKHYAGKVVEDNVTHPLLLGRDWRAATNNNTTPIQHSESKSTSLDIELSLIDSLSRNQDSRELLLEPGTVPMLIFYSGFGNYYEDYYRICAERTAAFHTCAGRSGISC
jgi:pimeloyl-ACP methyl ester carboxylesterase